MYLQENTLFDLDLRSHTRLPSTLNIMGLIYGQSLKWLNRTVLEMHLQENILEDFENASPYFALFYAIEKLLAGFNMQP